MITTWHTLAHTPFSLFNTHTQSKLHFTFWCISRRCKPFLCPLQLLNFFIEICTLRCSETKKQGTCTTYINSWLRWCDVLARLIRGKTPKHQQQPKANCWLSIEDTRRIFCLPWHTKGTHRSMLNCMAWQQKWNKSFLFAFISQFYLTSKITPQMCDETTR